MKRILINAGFHTRVEPLQAVLVRSVSRVLYLLSSGAALVLLIGALNVANLALAPLAAPRKEFATRMAIGAGRAQLLRQIVVEHVLVAPGGGGLGLLLANAILKGLALFGLDQFPRAEEVGINWQVAGATFGISILCGILIALLPLADVFRTNLSSVLHEDGRGGTGGISARRTRQSLVALEIGMAFA